MENFMLFTACLYFLCQFSVDCNPLPSPEKGQLADLEGNGRDHSAFDRILTINKNAEEVKESKRILKKKLIDGDIIMPPKTYPDARFSRHRRSDEYYGIMLWPLVNGKREVPYVIDIELLPHKSVIDGAINEWMQKVPCLNFVERSTQTDYLRFYNDSGCFSSIGKVGKEQGISLGLGCHHHEIVLHEIGHALGFWHEQSRPDRDKHVKILWENILSGMEFNFEIVKSYDYSQVSPYDTGSVMHYGPYAFANGTNQTIESLNKAPIAQSYHLSDADVQLAKSLYDCKSDCIDLNTGCKHWGNGDCFNEYRLWMLKYCRNTCCFSMTDAEQRCAYWASIGECEKNPWMLENCKWSCNGCATC